MDSLTHMVITRVLVGKKPRTMLVGILPDAPFYLTYPAWVHRHGGLRAAFRHNTWPDSPHWMETLHHAFHSVPLALVSAMMYRLVRGDWPARILAAWLLHVAVDLPTHSRGRWAPQFLWPVSNLAVDGISWAELAIRFGARFSALVRGKALSRSQQL